MGHADGRIFVIANHFTAAVRMREFESRNAGNINGKSSALVRPYEASPQLTIRRNSGDEASLEYSAITVGGISGTPLRALIHDAAAQRTFLGSRHWGKHLAMGAGIFAFSAL